MLSAVTRMNEERSGSGRPLRDKLASRSGDEPARTLARARATCRGQERAYEVKGRRRYAPGVMGTSEGEEETAERASDSLGEGREKLERPELVDGGGMIA